MQPSSVPLTAYPQPGDVLDGKYRVERLVGEGGMGAVAKATHLVRRAPVALKFISGAILSLPGAVERFINEGVAASQIDSDHVVKVFDVGRLPSGAPYLVMEFLDGRDLGELLYAEGPRLPPARAVHFALQMLRALQTAHNAGIVHRDMKPSNCFVVDKDGEPDFVKLVDFGISKFRPSDDVPPNANLTRTNSALGTPLYMSPEQARSPRDVDHRSDLYSVGAILYEMLGGRTPYTSDNGEYTEILFKIFTTEPEPLAATSPGVPEGLASVVHRALRRDRAMRHGSAAEMAEALAPFADARSAALLVKLRSARGRSMWPSEPSAAAPEARATPPPGPSGGTLPVPGPSGGTLDAVEPAVGGLDLRPPNVPTDVGLARDSVPRRRGTRSAARTGAVAAGAAVVLAAAGLLFARALGSGRAPGAAAARAGGGAAATATATTSNGTPSAHRPPASAELDLAPRALLPAATLHASETAPAASSAAPSPAGAARAPGRRPAPGGPPSAAAAQASAPAAGEPAPALPKQLSDLKLH